MYSLSVFISRVLIILCLGLTFLERSMAAESSDAPEEVVSGSSKSASVSPYLLKSGQLKAVVEIDSESKDQNRIKSLDLQAEGWTARFIGEGDTKVISAILLQQSPEKRIYLPDPDEAKILAWVKRTTANQPHYRNLIVEGKDQQALLIEVHTMPRAVTDLDKQKGILDYFSSKGLMSFDPDNSVQELKTATGFPYTYGKYRPIKDCGMVRLRVMSVTHDVAFLTDVIRGVSSLFRMFSEELFFPLHTYPTDREPGKPKVIMSYTALEGGVRQAFEKAGFSLDENPTFGEFWPPASRDKLSPQMIVAMQPVSEVFSCPPISLQLRKESEVIRHIEDSRPITIYLDALSLFLFQKSSEYLNKAHLSYPGLVKLIADYIKED